MPRYYNYSPGPGQGENAGEPSIGYNLTSHKAMYISGLQTFRVTFPDAGACGGLWEDVSYIYTKTISLDPILFTDQLTGRTFVSQLHSVVPPAAPVLIGLNSLMAYTDDDGANWTPAQINPPDGSYDHQSVGAGKYPASLPLGNPVNKGSAVYYASQAGVTAFCSRSDDGGLTFNPSRPIYTSVQDGCGGIHGHIKVAPDGTVYIPNRGCSDITPAPSPSPAPNVQSITVSEDAGNTWTVRNVQGVNGSGQRWVAQTAPGILDPSIGIASDGTLYYSWISGEADGGHAHVAVSHDKGQTWDHDVDLGTSYGLKNCVFNETVAGDPNRAAVGFLGTTASGNHEGDTFKGTWYAFIAHTYNGGQSWTTINATPNDPVQREAGIWNQGGNSPLRNLLDFNEITMDENGRVLYAYADGCINECVSGPPNTFASKATIAKQSGGNGLLAIHDPTNEPVIPQGACLTGRRDDMASYLRWTVPDNGGNDITSYKIYRGIAANDVTQLVGTALGSKTAYNDRSVEVSVPTYYYRIVAVNAVGSGTTSNIIALTVGLRNDFNATCGVPGQQVIVDPAADTQVGGQPQHDITSVSVAEPQTLAGKIAFVIKVHDLTTIPPAFRWAVRFGVQNVTPPTDFAGNASEDFFVSMVTTDNATPAFTWGVTSVPQGASRVFTTKGTLEAESNANVDGTITLVMLKSNMGNPAPGQDITNMLGSCRVTPPSQIPGSGGTNETIMDSTGGGSYRLRTANLCLPNGAPTARLVATPESGLKPLAVHFDAGTSSDPDTGIDTIAKYTFNFGDGTDDVVQTTPTIDHTFTEAGLYYVKLVVTDSRGKLSTNTDVHLVTVQLPLQSIVSRKGHNGTHYDVDLPPSGPAAIECRSGGANNDYSIVFTFNTNLNAVDTATITQGVGSISSRTMGPQVNQYTVNLTGVTNVQHLLLTLNGVHDSNGAIFNNQVARMDVLVGDANASTRVDSGDVSLVRQQTLQPVTSSNFREDINASGRIDSGDVSIVRQQALTSLPPSGSPSP